ncbi:uncharacterized protein BHQ10_006716 [Talaromyces amestolkiae]|uniref:NDT80 domain-containing protein n=1 Tax=Talaromyces amestolkiae TaxID=1196081 RepID=A0A364L4I4_TALAM|nr:uncharacterized protein BHQ10_006716 [Talaromyces amestolkiae]RAO70704.1 hypothetical protein BHQ10_006716 [Talaromyces amestolkiae]
MGLAACRSRELTRSVCRAAAKELACIGVNWLVGPVFDVHSDAKPQPMGVRCFGEYPEIVAEQALESMLGYQEGGLLTCIKHFPGFGNLDFVGSPADIPNVSGTFDQLLSTSLVPFQTAIDNGTDSILVGACGMPDVNDAQIPYSCLSHAVVTGLLRRRMGFGGVILSDCLEIEALYEGVGVSQAAAMAINAGCDVIMLCQSHSNQIEAIQGIKTAIGSGLLSKGHVQAAAGRVRRMKQRKLSWDNVWNLGGLSALDVMKPAHRLLSRSAYDASITLVRDLGHCIPLAKNSAPTDVLLLLTPLVEPFERPSKSEEESQQASSTSPTSPSKLVNIARHLNHRQKGYLEGESTFQELGVALAKRWRGKVVHTSYTASGISPLHERLVSEASAVVLLTADGVRNVYQYGFTKYIVSLCQGSQNQSPAASSTIGLPEKPCIVVAVSSPYDFMNDRQVTTYLCTYDLTGPPLNTLVRVLFGKLKATGLPPTARQTSPRSKVQRQLCYQPLFEAEHFIVRNSSTQKIYGFCATYFNQNLSRGIIAAIVVSTSHRGKGIGFSLHQYAMHSLEQRRGIEVVQFGSEIPVIFPGIPNRLSTHQLGLRSWVRNRGWDVGNWDHHDFYAIRLVNDWQPISTPEKIAIDNGFFYDTVQTQDHEELNQHLLIQTCFGAGNSLLRHPVVLSELYRRYRARNGGGDDATTVAVLNQRSRLITMSDLDLVDNLEEDELSENGMVSDLGIVGAVQDGDEHTPELLSFEAHEQFQPRTASNETYLTFQPLNLSQSQAFKDLVDVSLVSNIKIQAYLRGRFTHNDEASLPSTHRENAVDIANGTDDKDTIGLIFYRRNKFKVVGTISVPTTVTSVKHGMFRDSRITGLYAELDAIESLEGVPVRLIHTNPKPKMTSKSSQLDPSIDQGGSSRILTPRTAQGLPRVCLWQDKSDQDGDPSPNTAEDNSGLPIPIFWDKLQFRHATAKKRGYNDLQWQDGDENAGELSTLNGYLDSENLMNTSTRNTQSMDPSNNLLIPSSETHLLPSVPNLGSIFNLPDSLSSLSANYSSSQDAHGATLSSFASMPLNSGMDEAGSSSLISPRSLENLGRKPTSSEKPNTMDEDESDFTDDERKTYSYEYIPLSINDWTVPVDAVYRPHGVHARKVPNTEKSVMKKRYFISAK